MDRRSFTVYVLFVLLVTPVQGKTDQSRKKGWTWDDVLCVTMTCAGAVVIGVGVVYAVPVVLSAVGFTSTGIAANTMASKLMAKSAIANGGGTASGGTVAKLQSIAAKGLSTIEKYTIGTTAGGVFIYATGGC